MPWKARGCSRASAGTATRLTNTATAQIPGPALIRRARGPPAGLARPCACTACSSATLQGRAPGPLAPRAAAAAATRPPLPLLPPRLLTACPSLAEQLQRWTWWAPRRWRCRQRCRPGPTRAAAPRPKKRGCACEKQQRRSAAPLPTTRPPARRAAAGGAHGAGGGDAGGGPRGGAPSAVSGALAPGPRAGCARAAAASASTSKPPASQTCRHLPHTRTPTCCAGRCRRW